jgi:hypothetical protein
MIATMTRWQMIGAYSVLLLTCIAGVFRIGPWCIVASASLLALISFVANRMVSVAQGSMVGEPAMLAAHVLNSTAIASAAYILGFVARWAWGL